LANKKYARPYATRLLTLLGLLLVVFTIIGDPKITGGRPTTNCILVYIVATPNLFNLAPRKY
jgi:hypothetical protein